MGIHYDYKSTRGDKAMKKEAKKKGMYFIGMSSYINFPCQTKNKYCITHDKNNIFYADDDHPSEKGAQMINDILIKELYNIMETLNEAS